MNAADAFAIVFIIYFGLALLVPTFRSYTS